MEYYKFTTIISEDGKIQMPDDKPALFNKEVEITIVPKQRDEIKKVKASEFVKKWAGVLSVDDVEETKYQYLLEKHR